MKKTILVSLLMFGAPIFGVQNSCPQQVDTGVSVEAVEIVSDSKMTCYRGNMDVTAVQITALGPCTATLEEAKMHYGDGSYEIHELDGIQLAPCENVVLETNREKSLRCTLVSHTGCSSVRVEWLSDTDDSE